MCLRGGARLASCALHLEPRPERADACTRAPSRRLAHSQSFQAPRLRRGSVRIAPHFQRRAASSSPTWLGLGHPPSVLTDASRCQSSPRTFALLFLSRARAPEFSKCPASQLIGSWARHRRRRPLRTPPGLSWRLPGFGHTLAPLQPPPAHLTRRAVDSHSFAVLATDAHG